MKRDADPHKRRRYYGRGRSSSSGVDVGRVLTTKAVVGAAALGGALIGAGIANGGLNGISIVNPFGKKK